jgi:hypothetical protein
MTAKDAPSITTKDASTGNVVPDHDDMGGRFCHITSLCFIIRRWEACQYNEQQAADLKQDTMEVPGVGSQGPRYRR